MTTILSQSYPYISSKFSEIEFINLKSSLTASISNIEFNHTNSQILLEFNELIEYVPYGGKKSYIVTQLHSIPELDSKCNIDDLANHIINTDGSFLELKELFDLWINDNLINVDLLMSPGKQSFNTIFNGYRTNSVISKLVNTLSRVSSQSIGKGEYLLSVFSNQIYKRPYGGDLSIQNKNIELKTTDGGSARFSDQHVKPLPTYFSKVSQFRNTWKDELDKWDLPKTGLSINWIYDISSEIPESKLDNYYNDITDIFKQLLPNFKVKVISDLIREGKLSLAKEVFAAVNIEYYKSIKTDDDGILYLNIAKTPAFSVYFESYEDLRNNRLELHTNTFYPIVFSTECRDAYPQIDIRRY